LRFYANEDATTLIVEDTKARQTTIAFAKNEQLRAFTASREATPEPGSKTGTSTAAAEAAPLRGQTVVRLAWQKLTSLPDVFEQLSELTELDLSGNQLQSLPASLWRTPNLKLLDVSHNPLHELPEAVGELRSLRALLLRDCPVRSLPASLAQLVRLDKLWLTECAELDVDAALQLIARLPKLKTLGLPLSQTLTTLAPLAHLPLRSLSLRGQHVLRPSQLPAGLGKLHKLSDLSIDGADDVERLPEATEDVRALRLLFHKRFTDSDIRASASKQPERKYLTAFAKTL
jgi:Leucine-rich repeat (LRR) protein